MQQILQNGSAYGAGSVGRPITATECGVNIASRLYFVGSDGSTALAACCTRLASVELTVILRSDARQTSKSRIDHRRIRGRSFALTSPTIIQFSVAIER